MKKILFEMSNKIRTRWNNLPLQTYDNALPRTVATITGTCNTLTSIPFTFAGMMLMMTLIPDDSDDSDDSKEFTQLEEDLRRGMRKDGLLGTCLLLGISSGATGYAAGYVVTNLVLHHCSYDFKKNITRRLLPPGSNAASAAIIYGLPLALTFSKNYSKPKLKQSLQNFQDSWDRQKARL